MVIEMALIKVTVKPQAFWLGVTIGVAAGMVATNMIWLQHKDKRKSD